MILLALLLAAPPAQPPMRVVSVDGGDTLTVSCDDCSGSSLIYIVDAGPPINVNPVAVSSLPTVFIQDAGVLNVQGAFYQATQPVSLSTVPAHGITGQVSVNITDAGAPLNVQGAFWQATQPVSIASMPSTPVTGPISVNLLDAGAPLNVQGTFWQATQPISATNLDVALSTRTKPSDQQHVIVDTVTPTVTVTGALTDTQLRSSVVPVYVDGGVIGVTQVTSPWVVSGTVTASGPVTDTQLRASVVPVYVDGGTVLATQGTSPWVVSGTVTASGPVTDTQLRASAVPVSLASMPSTPVTGTFWQGTQPVSAANLPLPTGAATDSTLSQLFDGGIAVRVVSQTLPNPYPLNPFLPRCNPVRRTGCQP